MAVIAPPYLYVTEDDLDAIMSPQFKRATVDDNRDKTPNQRERSFITFARVWATDRVNFFLLSRYEAECLSESPLVNQWALCCAAYWLSQRRGNPVPMSWTELYKEAIADMKLVHDGRYEIPACGIREVFWPAWSNVRFDLFYTLRHLRVERPISEKTPVTYRQNVDTVAEFFPEPF